MDAIQYPRHLYRFRPVSFSSLDGLQGNKLYFSSADHYDDPFDSFLHIDIPQTLLYNFINDTPVS